MMYGIIFGLQRVDIPNNFIDANFILNLYIHCFRNTKDTEYLIKKVATSKNHLQDTSPTLDIASRIPNEKRELYITQRKYEFVKITNKILQNLTKLTHFNIYFQTTK